MWNSPNKTSDVGKRYDIRDLAVLVHPLDMLLDELQFLSVKEVVAEATDGGVLPPLRHLAVGGREYRATGRPRVEAKPLRFCYLAPTPGVLFAAINRGIGSGPPSSEA